MSVGLLSLSLAVTASAALPQPVLHYRSDNGITTNADGKVTGWKNLGTLGVAGDVAAESNSDITYKTDGANGSPSVVFGGVSSLKTAGNVNLGITGSSGGSWFVALKVSDTYDRNRGLVGMTSDSARFGAFYPTGNKMLFRCYVNSSTTGKKYSDRDQRSGWYLLSLSGWGSNLRPYNGWYSAAIEQPDGYSCLDSWAAPFYVGNMGSYTWCNPFLGEIAEIRCYDRALTSSERTAVQMEMGIYSGVKANVTSFKGVELFEADGRAYVNEAASFGLTPGVGPVETLVASGASGGLYVSFANALDESAETATYLAHDGTTGRYRTWCLAMDRKTTSDAIDQPITLTLDATAAADLPDEVSVLYRASTTGSWQTLSKVRKDAGGAVTVWLDSWKNGYYRFASRVTAAGNLVLHYRADEGVSVGEGGKVTGWKNLGTLGASGDVAVAEETSDITYSATGANGSPSVVFGGTTYLKTAGNVNLGIQGSAGGGCWFVALKVTGPYFGNRGLLGTTSDNARFGAFFPTGNTKQFFRCYVNASTSGDKYCDRDMRSGWYLLSLSGWGANLRPYNGWYSADVETPDSYTCLNSWSAPFSVGNLGSSYTWCNPFLGEIAEIRCYDRALTSSERTAVQMEMSIYSGVKADMTSFRGVELFEADGRAYVHDGVAFGYMHGLGPTETPVASATSGELTVGYVDELGVVEGTNTVAYLAHNGLTGLDRTWCLSADNGPGGWVLGNAFAIRFAYRGDLPRGASALYRKTSPDGFWRRIGDMSLSDDGQSLTCALEPGWQNGYYQIREKKGLAIIVR